MSAYRALAPAKINLGLFVGPVRDEDRKHELVSVMQSISLADELTLEPAPGTPEGDVVVCPGVPGDPEDNLAARALRAFREATGWDGPPRLLRIDKRIPLAAGLAGGSADAAATLRLARAASGLGDDELLRTIAARLGADVPAQVAPGRWLASGAGERLVQLPPPARSLAVLVIPAAGGLSTAGVFAEFDREALTRTPAELDELASGLEGAFARGAPLPAARELLHNDLERPAAALCPEIVGTLRLAREASAGGEAFVSGSGPTVVCVFASADASGEAETLAHEARARLGAEGVPRALLASAVGEEFGAPRATDSPVCNNLPRVR
jgi:4-diphosphocytidyl-2-C-methyl-D-erythritol kinase